MAKSIKYIYADIRFSIKVRDNHWWLDFYNFDKKRIRKSTDLKAIDINLLIVKKKIIPDFIGKMFQETLQELGIKGKVLYNLRHTFASRLVAAGIDITRVSKYLGHSSSKITYDLYVDFIPEDEDTRLKNIAKIDTIMDTI